MTNHFEAKLHGFRRTQDGVVISYVIHPDDVRAEIATAALGTRYMIGFAELGDDNQPVQSSPHSAPVKGVNAEAKLESDPSNGEITRASKRKFSDLPLSQQAGIRCQDKQFQIYLMDQWAEIAAHHNDAGHIVRKICKVASRAEFDQTDTAANGWIDLEWDYQQWLTTKNYAESVR